MPQWGIEFAERADVDIEARASRSRARYQAHDDKGRTLLLRISVVLALIGMFMDIAMGVRQDFALAPAHAHLNLLGFLMLFMAGLYYRIVPQAAEGLPGRLYAALAVIGAIAFPTGIAAVELGGRIASRHS
jgi:peptidoglycan/LPS O-acetylase OafA/YrhL